MGRRKEAATPETPENVCLRCGTPYEDGATVCFTCGAPIGEIKTPTQPVPVPRVPKPEASDPVETEATPVATAAHSTAARSMVRPGAHPATRKRPRRWPFVVLALVVALAAAGGTAYLLRGALAGPPVATRATYRDPERRFTLTQPALWTATPRSDGVLLTDSDGINRVVVTISAPQAGEDAAAYADALAASRGLSRVPSKPIAGQTWESRMGIATGPDGVTRETAIYVTPHDGLLYTVACTSPLSSYDAMDNLVYQPLLASFAFTD